MAGRQGFEPQEAFTSTVFKTAAFDRSAISRLRAGRPRRRFAQIKTCTHNLFGFFSDPLGAVVNLFFGPLSRVVRILFYAVPSIRAPAKNHQCQKSRQYVSHNNSFLGSGGDTRIRTGDQSFAGSCLTTWLCRRAGLLGGARSRT